MLGGYTTAYTAFQRTICRANLRSIDGAILTYYSNNEKLPSSVRELVEGGFLNLEPQELQGGDYLIEVKSGEARARCSKDHAY